MKYNRYFPLLIPVVVLSLFEVFFFHPKMIYVVLVLVNLSVFFALWQFARTSQIDKCWWNFLILPSLMSSSAVAYSIFLDNKLIIQLLWLAVIILLYFYLRYTYYYLLNPLAYKPFSIESISSFSNWLTFFLAAAVAYGLQSFLNLSVWPLELILLLIIFLIIYQIIWANKIALKASALYILICSLVLVELSWSISFLPFNYNIAGLILAICYYILIGLVKDYLLNRLDKKTVELYLGIGLASLILILFTAQWI